MYCGSTKISELCIELQNSLMLNPQVGEERSVVLCAYSNSVFMEPKIEECLKSYYLCPSTYATSLLHYVKLSMISKKKFILYVASYWTFIH